MNQRYIATLLEGAGALGLTVSAEVAERMAVHHDLVVKWGQRINLTTVTDPERAAVIHGLDSLLFAEAIDPLDRETTVDVGSGAGFPGIVVALVRPELVLTLLEPIRKRASFLRTALATLGLSSVRVVEGKLEARAAVVPRGVRWPVARIISRATIPPLELVALAASHLEPGGSLVLSGGAGAPNEATLSAAAEVVGLTHAERRAHTLPGGDRRFIDILVRPDVTDRG